MPTCPPDPTTSPGALRVGKRMFAFPTKLRSSRREMQPAARPPPSTPQSGPRQPGEGLEIELVLFVAPGSGDRAVDQESRHRVRRLRVEDELSVLLREDLC